MTSKISFHKLVREDMKKRSWLTALSIVIFVIIIPIFSLVQIEEQLAGIGENMTPSELEGITEWFVHRVGLENLGMAFAVMIGAVICGVTSFSYLHSKSQVDFYHSLPIKREKLFAATYVGSLIQVMVPYLIGYAVINIEGYVKGIMTPQAVKMWPITIGVLLLFFLLFYSITILSMILTGKFIVAMFGFGIFMFGGSLMASLYYYTMIQGFETFVTYKGYAGILGNMVLGKMSWLSPILAYGNMTTLDLAKGELVKPIIMIAICVLVISLLSLALYCVRASEGAGNAIAFPRLRSVIKIVLSIATGILFGIVIGSQNRSRGMNAGWLFGMGILATVLMYAVVEFIYSNDLKIIFKKKLSLGIALMGTLTVLSVVKYDLFGYDTYLPKQEKVEAMSLYSQRADSIWVGIDYSNDYTSKEMMEGLKVEEFAPIYELAKNGVDSLGKELPNKDYIEVAYYLKNGRTAYRKYYVDSDKFMECMNELMEDKSYREKMFNFVELEREKEVFEFINFRQQTETLRLSKEEEKALIETYKQELIDYPISEFENGEIIGEFYCEFVEGKHYRRNIYKSFTKTIALLEKYGYEVPTKITVEEVKSMEIQKYDDLNEETAEEWENVKLVDGKVTDPIEMQKILERISYKENKFTIPSVYVDITFQNDNLASYRLREE